MFAMSTRRFIVSSGAMRQFSAGAGGPPAAGNVLAGVLLTALFSSVGYKAVCDERYAVK